MIPDSAVAVVTGGGTAGHVLPALAVADTLIERGIQKQEVLYVGCERGIETELVPPTGLGHVFLDVVGLQRSLTKRNIAFVPKMLAATRQATRLLRRVRPKVVVSVGGYASMPSVFAARRLGIPVVAVSFDHIPGLASRLTARLAAASAVAFPDSPLPRATLTGAPVRRGIREIDRARERDRAREQLGVEPDRFLIAVMGGSQGSGALNDAVWEMLGQRRGDERLAIRHAVGSRFVDRAPDALDGSDGIVYQPIGFEHDMASVYAAADLLVGRGGASTVHEVAAVGIPAVLVPWPDAAEDHQTANVSWLSEQGGAVLLPEADIDQLAATIDRLRADRAGRDELARAARAMGEHQRSGALADLLLGAAGVSPSS